MIDQQVLKTIADKRWMPQFAAGMVLTMIRGGQPVEAKAYMDILMAIVNRPVPEIEMINGMVKSETVIETSKQALNPASELASVMETIVARPITRLLIDELTGPERATLDIPGCFR